MHIDTSLMNRRDERGPVPHSRRALLAEIRRLHGELRQSGKSRYRLRAEAVELRQEVRDLGFAVATYERFLRSALDRYAAGRDATVIEPGPC